MSLPVAGFGLDVGATWFWPGESRVQALVDRMKIATHPQYLAGNAVYHDPRGTQTIGGNPIDVPSHRFVAGAQALAESLAQALPTGVLQLSHSVTQIVQTEEGVAAVGLEKTFAAKHVVLSVPPALAVSSITFEPALPDSVVRLAQHTPVWMGGTTKVVARYPTPFWRARGLAGAGISHVGPLREVHDMSGPDGVPAMLFGFAPPMRVGAPTPSSEQVLAQLVEMFGSEAADPLQLVIHDWRHERFTSPKDVEALDAYHLYGHPLYASPVLGDRVHWASTETALESPGHIEGALAGADRAAQAVIVALGSGT